MVLKLLRASGFSACCLFLLAGASAIAQTDSYIYDGFTIEQLEEILSELHYNNDAMTVVRRQTSAGSPYLVLTAPELDMPISVGGIGSQYKDSNGGPFEGILILTVLPKDELSNIEFNLSNSRSFYFKVIDARSSIILRTEILAAGGITKEVVMNAIQVFVDRRAEFLTENRTTVSYSPPGNKTEEAAREAARNIYGPSTAPTVNIKAANAASHIMNRDIEALIDTASDQ
ncbi:hypothetical protein PUV54_08350 [Hyphococcus flavus]|uniref:Uncharacterized protein n=1 Tax=Hyphococcus flavus TaxID=1866326 RepID=A0AAF0CG85_9PROT|nr:hypothetical protein [Hyphococcus flavus]WDI33206.1 hypothetical protein PUV54_08350 [Hyphococcus flavus]